MLTRWRQGLSRGLSGAAGSEAAGSAGRDAPAPPEVAPNAAPEATPATLGPDPAAEALDPAPEPIAIKKVEERRRRKRKVPAEPPVPTFIMVSPGRYVRAEEPAPSSAVAAEVAVEDGTDPRDPTHPASGGSAGRDPDRPEDGEARLGQGQGHGAEQPEGIGEVPE
jgi:hypothetical protein